MRPPGPPRHAHPGDGVLPVQQRRRHRGRAGRARRAGADRRLRRPPRQRHPGHLLEPTGASPTSRFHQYPLYPGTGGLREVGAGAGRGTTINLPLPAGATGDAFRAGVDEVLAPFAAAFDPTWLLISAGFDAHRADPDHRPRALGRRLRRPHHRAAGAGAPGPAASCSSRAATTSRRWPRRRRPAWRALLGERLVPEPAHQRGPGPGGRRRRRPGPGGARRLRLKFGAAGRADVGQMTQLEELLSYLHEVQGSDLHLKPGAVPHVRVDGQLRPTPFEVPAPGVVEALAAGMLDSRPPGRPRHHRRGQLRVQRRRPRPLPGRHPPPARLARHGRAPRPAGDPRPRRAGPAPAGGALRRGGEGPGARHRAARAPARPRPSPR